MAAIAMSTKSWSISVLRSIALGAAAVRRAG
jgi:hypothetical protein